MARYENILETIGNTPLVRLNKLAPAGVNVYVKVESFNPHGLGQGPHGARRHRARRADAARCKPGQTVIEATSGNTGIGLAMVCAQKGYPLVVTMAESFSVERRKLLRFLGAKVVLTPASEKGSGMLAKAVELARTARLVPVPAVRERSQRRRAHAHDGAGDPRRLRGRAARLLGHGLRHRRHAARASRARCKQASPATQIIAAEPDNAQVLGSGIPQPRDADGSRTASHPRFRPHLMQGWAPDFISRLTEDAVDGRPDRRDRAGRG